jgi:hypothetical protein
MAGYGWVLGYKVIGLQNNKKTGKKIFSLRFKFSNNSNF